MSKNQFNYKNYAFDLYGTLVDIITDEDDICFWKKVAKKLNTTPEDLKKTYKEQCKQRVDMAGENKEFDLLEVFEYLAEKYNSPLTSNELAWFFRVASIKYERLYKHVKRKLKTLKKAGYGVYLISNAQACFTLKELENLGIGKLFDGIVISSMVGYKKPSTEIFEIAFDKFGIDKKDTLFVGNDLHDDILGAVNFGVDYYYIETKQSGHYPELEYLKLKK